MAESEWILDEAVLVVRQIQLDRHGVCAGIRDAGLLSSALNRPRNLWSYSSERPAIAALAAAYAFGISSNHPFLDGNQPTAAVVCETFVEVNGFERNASDHDWYKDDDRLASGRITENELSAWIRRRLESQLV